MDNPFTEGGKSLYNIKRYTPASLDDFQYYSIDFNENLQ